MTKHSICFGDLDETFGSARVIGIAVRMMGFGQAVERSGTIVRKFLSDTGMALDYFFISLADAFCEIWRVS